MTQYVRPTSTVDSSNFLTTAYTDVNEDPYDDGDYVQASDANAGYIEFALNDPTDPDDHTGHILTCRIAQEGNSNIRTYQLELLQGSTQIAIGSAVNTGTVFIDCVLTLSETEAGNITDYTDLRAKIYTAGDIGPPDKNRSYVYISHVEFETPDAEFTYDLTGDDVTSGIPVVDEPTATQTFILTGQDVITEPPVIDSPTISQDISYDLIGDDVTSGIPVIDEATVGQTFALTGEDVITEPPIVDDSVISQTFVLTGEDVVTEAPVVDGPTIAQTFALTADEVLSGIPVVDAPTLEMSSSIIYVDGYGGDIFTDDDTTMNYWDNGTRNGGGHGSLAPTFNVTVRESCLLRFDLSAIPASANCLSVKLILVHSQVFEFDFYSLGNIHSVAEANGDWVAGDKNIELADLGETCWNAKSADGAGGVDEAWAGSVGCLTSGTDYESTVLGTWSMYAGEDSGFEYEIDITGVSRIEQWFGSNDNNYGIILVPTAYTVHVGQSNNPVTAYRPKLVVEYELADTQDLTGDDVTSGIPVADSPSISQTFVLTGDVVLTEPPVVDAPSIGQIFGLTGEDVVSEAPEVTNPTVAQTFALTGEDVITEPPSVSDPFVSQEITYDLFGEDVVTEPPIVGEGTLTQTFILTGEDVVSEPPEVDNPTISQSYILTGEDVVSEPLEVDNPIIAQIFALTGEDVVTEAPIVSDPFVSQEIVYHLTGEDVVTEAPEVTNPIISQIFILTSEDVVTEAPEIDDPLLSQIYILTGEDVVTEAPEVDDPTIFQDLGYALIGEDVITEAPLISDPLLAQLFALVGDDVLTGVPVVGNPHLSMEPLITPLKRRYRISSEERIISILAEDRGFGIDAEDNTV